MNEKNAIVTVLPNKLESSAELPDRADDAALCYSIKQMYSDNLASKYAHERIKICLMKEV